MKYKVIVKNDKAELEYFQDIVLKKLKVQNSLQHDITV